MASGVAEQGKTRSLSDVVRVNIAVLSDFSVPALEHPRRPSGTSQGAAEEATQTTSAACLRTLRRLRIYFPSLYLNGVKEFIINPATSKILSLPSPYFYEHLLPYKALFF